MVVQNLGEAAVQHQESLVEVSFVGQVDDPMGAMNQPGTLSLHYSVAREARARVDANHDDGASAVWHIESRSEREKEERQSRQSREST